MPTVTYPCCGCGGTGGCCGCSVTPNAWSVTIPPLSHDGIGACHGGRTVTVRRTQGDAAHPVPCTWAISVNEFGDEFFGPWIPEYGSPFSVLNVSLFCWDGIEGPNSFRRGWNLIFSSPGAGTASGWFATYFMLPDFWNCLGRNVMPRSALYENPLFCHGWPESIELNPV